jgi:hypothetical protein
MFFKKDFRYILLRELYRWYDKVISKQIDQFNVSLRQQYQRENAYSDPSLKKVYIHGIGSEWFYTSTLDTIFQFVLTEDPELADLIIFITIIDKELANRLMGKSVGIFFREPSAYVTHHKNDIPKTFFENNSVFIVTHLDGSQIGFSNHENAQIIRSFFYPHYHHWATSTDLKKSEMIQRSREIFSLTSGLSGIPGNIQRRDFIEKLSMTNPNFDLYGRFTPDSYKLKAYRGLCAFKKDLLFKYKYNLIIENTNEDWYISEKIFDSLICGCMPIYHGTEKVFDLIPGDWFYYLPTLESIEIEKLNQFLKTEAYLIVSNNRQKIAEYIHNNFSFYQCIAKILEKEELGIPNPVRLIKH